MLQPLLTFLSGGLVVSQLSGVSAIAYRHPDTHHGRAALLQTKNKLRVTKQRSRAQRAKRAGKYTTWKTKNGKKMQTSSKSLSMMRFLKRASLYSHEKTEKHLMLHIDIEKNCRNQITEFNRRRRISADDVLRGE